MLDHVPARDDPTPTPSTPRFPEQEARELRAVVELTEKINAGLTLDGVLDGLWESLRTVVAYDRIGLALIDEDGQTVSARWARSNATQLRLGSGFKAALAGSSLQSILETGEPRLIGDLEAYLGTHPDSESTRRIVEEGMRSSVTCPLIVEGRPVGFLFLTSRMLHAYGPATVGLLARIAGQVSVVVEKSRLYEQLLQAQERSERLLSNLLPASIAARLKAKPGPLAEGFDDVTILFADLVGFTGMASQLSPAHLVRMLDGIFSDFDVLADTFGLEKIKTIGDAYMAVAGLPIRREGHAEAAVEMALEMLRVASRYTSPDGSPLRLRIGLNTGPVVAGVIGRQRQQYDLWGDAVNIASRMESQGVPGRIHVAPATRERLQGRYLFEDRGHMQVKGRGEMHTWLVAGRVLGESAAVADFGEMRSVAFEGWDI